MRLNGERSQEIYVMTRGKILHDPPADRLRVGLRTKNNATRRTRSHGFLKKYSRFILVGISAERRSESQRKQ